MLPLLFLVACRCWPLRAQHIIALLELPDSTEKAQLVGHGLSLFSLLTYYLKSNLFFGIIVSKQEAAAFSTPFSLFRL